MTETIIQQEFYSNINQEKSQISQNQLKA